MMMIMTIMTMINNHDTLIIAFTRDSLTILSKSHSHWPQVKTMHTGCLYWKGTEHLLGKVSGTD